MQFLPRNRNLTEFCRVVGNYLNQDPNEILRYVRNQARKKIDRANAKEIISRRRTIAEQLKDARASQ